jgi:dUTP pyrophosphatase
MKVKIKKLHPDAVLPAYAKPGDGGMDLTTISEPEVIAVTNEYCYVNYKTGLAIEIPEGFVGYIFPRSSISKKMLSLTNSVGVIDSGYRGEIGFRFRVDLSALNPNEPQENKGFYKRGDRIGQLIIMPYPKIELEEVPELSKTIRGGDGFGSTS